MQDGGQRDGMILAKEAIEKAVNWWAEKILEDRPHSNGDDSFTSITACLLADMGRQNITPDQADMFKKALAKRMAEYAESGMFNHFSIMCDYGPCGMLIDAANEAGISAANFPFKTTMFVTEKRWHYGTRWLWSISCQAVGVTTWTRKRTRRQKSKQSP